MPVPPIFSTSTLTPSQPPTTAIRPPRKSSACAAAGEIAAAMATLIVIAFMLKLPLSSNETCRYILHFWRIRHPANTWDESIKILGTLPGIKVSIWPDRKSFVEGKGVAVRVDLGGGRI